MEHLIGILEATGNLWMQMAVYLVFGFLVAGILSRVLKSELIYRHLGAKSSAAVVKASLLGVPLPLCSCGVIPVGLSLFRRGASRGAATSFLISTPQTGVDSILVTYALLGPLGLLFAVLRPIIAFLNGILGGMLVNWFDHHDPDEPAETDVEGDACESGACSLEAGEEEGGSSLWDHARGAFRYGFIDFPREIAGWLVIGIVVAGVVSHFMPTDPQILSRYLGLGLLPMIVMAVAGIPFYICATASIPFVAVLLSRGLSPGAALVFLMTGPATNTTTLIMLGRVLGKRATGLYLGSILLTSFVFGYLVDVYFRLRGGVPEIDTILEGREPMLWQIVGGVLLILIVGAALVGNLRDALRRRGERRAESEEMTEIPVAGMTCEHCAQTVAEAAKSTPGVVTAIANARKGVLSITGEPDMEALRRSVESAGYDVRV